MAFRSEGVNFTGGNGATLAARLDYPAGQPRAFALFAHCFTCSKDILAASRIAGGLAEAGIAVLRFDFTGLGHSDGEFANTDYSANLDDLVAAADWLRETHQAPAILVGHSLGGAAVLAAAGRIPEDQGVATVNAPFYPGHVSHQFGASISEINDKGEAEVSLAGRPFRIRKQFLDDLAGHRMEELIGGLRRHLLVFHAPTDASVGIENAGQIFGAAKHPKSFVSLDGADHLLTRRQDTAYVANMLSAWASRFAPEQPSEIERAGAGEVVVTEAEDGRFAQLIAAGPHQMRGDEPPSIGGTDPAPRPMACCWPVWGRAPA
jgi:alpha/beta superfamily hydrolase